MWEKVQMGAIVIENLELAMSMYIYKNHSEDKVFGSNDLRAVTLRRLAQIVTSTKHLNNKT